MGYKYASEDTLNFFGYIYIVVYCFENYKK